MSFQAADLVSVLETLAKEMGAYSYIAPTIRGAVTIELRDVPADEAVRQVLVSQKTEYAFILLDDAPVKSTKTLVVATPEELVELIRSSSGGADITRMEYILEEAPADSGSGFSHNPVHRCRIHTSSLDERILRPWFPRRPTAHQARAGESGLVVVSATAKSRTVLVPPTKPKAVNRHSRRHSTRQPL